MKYYFLILLIGFCSALSFCQDSVSINNINYNDWVEEVIIEEETESLSLNQEQLLYYREHPLSINLAKEEELIASGLFTQNQVKSLLDYRKTYGFFYEENELLATGNFSENEVAMIVPFITTKREIIQPNVLLSSLKTGKHFYCFRTVREVEKRRGYLDSTYLGSPWHIYQKYRFQAGYNFSVGLTLEKDAGETFFKGKNSGWSQGFDFVSPHFFIRGRRFIKTLAIGDYQLQFGQGLTQWNGYQPLSSSNLAWSGTEIAPYTSSNENNYLRGIAISYKLAGFKFSNFISSKNIDAKVLWYEDNFEPAFFSTVYTTGYHRTAAEEQSEKTVGELLYGQRISKKLGALYLGTTFIGKSYNAATYLNDKILSKGKPEINSGFDYKFHHQKISLLGETTLQRKALKTKNTLNLTPFPSINVGISNQLSKGYTSLSFQTTFYPSYQLKFRYYSALSNSKSYYRTNLFPKQKQSHFLQVDFTPHQYQTFYFRINYRNEQEIKLLSTDDLPKPSTSDKLQIRLHSLQKTSFRFQFSNRLEVSQSTFSKTKGFLIYQEVKYMLKKPTFHISMRVALFDVDDYEQRIYAYETDMLYNYSAPAHYGKGSRILCMIRYKINSQLNLWVKYVQTRFTDRNQISSGQNLINHPHVSQFKFQLIYTP